MLAAWTNYLFVWQLPMFGAFAAVWLIGGPYLTRRALGRYADLPRSKRRMGRCAQLNFLATGTGLAALVIVAGFFVILGSKLGSRLLSIAGALPGLLAMMAMSWAVALSMLALRAKTVLRITAATTGPMVALLVAVGAGAFVPAWFARQAEVQRLTCRRNLHEIRVGLQLYATRGEQAPSLKALAESKLIQAEYLTCPAEPELDIGYLYLPAEAAQRGQHSRTVRVCDRHASHGSKRLVLFTDGRIELVGGREFEQLLRLPENEALAKLVAAEP